MSFNAGILTVYETSNGSPSGFMPRKTLTKKTEAFYRCTTVGVSRYYTALQNSQRIDNVVETPNYIDCSTDDVCMLEDGLLYRVRQVQFVADRGIEITRIALERINDDYE